ncbi:hypothetical protein F4861DRAFT_438174 [Xylaria intraflava]|nr:hypothetical protein F4861DRAFT_438174 [Xylaria intraflava]
MLLRRAFLLSTGVFSGLAAASGSTLVFVTSVESCSYESGSGGVAPTPISTVKTKDSTESFVSTHDAVTVPSTVSVLASTTSTASTVTSTQLAVVTDTVTVPTTTIGSFVTQTIATVVVAETVCADKAKPVTVTEYTGTYEPISGQATTLLETYPTQAFCTTSTMFSVGIFPTVTSGAVTETVTPVSTPASYETTVVTKTIVDGLLTVYATTSTETITSYAAAVVTTTSTISCAETVTKTLAAQCAPSNLISAIDDEGILSGNYADRYGTAYILEEPSACCQICLDNEGCAAIMAADGGCSLFYGLNEDAEAVCDTLVYSYTSSNTTGAGQGLIVQNGCGKVEYVPPSQL